MPQLQTPTVRLLDPQIGDFTSEHCRIAGGWVFVKRHLECGDNHLVLTTDTKLRQIKPIAPTERQNVANPRVPIDVRNAAQHVVGGEQLLESRPVALSYGVQQRLFTGADIDVNPDAGLQTISRPYKHRHDRICNEDGESERRAPGSTPQDGISAS